MHLTRLKPKLKIDIHMHIHKYTLFLWNFLPNSGGDDTWIYF
jgi:hypothetical protein